MKSNNKIGNRTDETNHTDYVVDLVITVFMMIMPEMIWHVTLIKDNVFFSHN